MKHSHFFILIITCIFSTSCFCVQKLSLSKQNPTEYVFPISKRALLDSLTDGIFRFRISRRDKIRYYDKNSDKIKVAFGSGDCYKNYSGSYIYRKGNNGKSHGYSFKMQIDSLTPDSCRVKFSYLHGYLYTRIIKLGDRWVLKRKLIPSTTIEEYEMLRLIGKRLGVLSQMPLVNYPDGLTRDQIRMTYGYYQNFTYEEMFGVPQPESEKDPVYTEKELKKRKRKEQPSTKFDYSKCAATQH